MTEARRQSRDGQLSISAHGAQILCPIPLKPQQRVRMILGDDLGWRSSAPLSRGRRSRFRKVRPATARASSSTTPKRRRSTPSACGTSHKAVPTPNHSAAADFSRMIVSFAFRPGRDDRHGHAGDLFEQRDVALRFARQVLVARDAGGRRGSSRAASRRPARTRRAASRSAGHSLTRRCRAAVAGAHADLVEPVEHVELGQRQRVEAVDARGVAHRHGVVPAAAARPAGRRRRTPGRSRAAACRARPCSSVGSGPSPTRVVYAFATPSTPSIARGPHAEAGADAADRRVRRRHVRIGAVIDVEQRALRALEHDRAGPRASR